MVIHTQSEETLPRVTSAVYFWGATERFALFARCQKMSRLNLRVHLIPLARQSRRVPVTRIEREGPADPECPWASDEGEDALAPACGIAWSVLLGVLVWTLLIWLIIALL